MALTNILLSCLTDSGFWVVFLLVFTVLLYLRSRSSQSSAPLPPGPPVYPMIGSYLSLRDTPNPLEAMINLAEKYGNVTFGKVSGKIQYLSLALSQSVCLSVCVCGGGGCQSVCLSVCLSVSLSLSLSLTVFLSLSLSLCVYMCEMCVSELEDVYM